MAVRLVSKGNWNKTKDWMRRMEKGDYIKILEKYAEEGVKALARATPKDSGKTASSWSYSITSNNAGYIINWNNSNVNKGVNIALILQYGHGTGTGGYVSGRDYINPAIRPTFDRIAQEAWKEVTRP